jgi:uncharacterized phage protein gp47/JayE
MSEFGLTDAGFVLKRLADIKAELEATFQSAFGSGINLDARTPEGQIIGIQAERESLIWELAQSIYNIFNPDAAQGASLDGLAAITAVSRLAATYSTVTAIVHGSDGTVIPAGFVVSVAGNKSARFVTTASGVIAGGVVSLPFQAESTGPVQAPSGTLAIIETPVSGVTSVSNALDAVIGRATETDAEFRLRRQASLSREGAASHEGIRKKILAVFGVVRASVIENDTGTTDSDGRPAHSIECVASGGDDQAVADAIYFSKAAGILTYGGESETVIDSQGVTHTIKFSRPENILVYLKVLVTQNNNPNEGPVYPETGDANVKAAVLAFGNSTQMGRDVILSQYYTPINTVPGVFGMNVQQSIDGTHWFSTNLVISANQLAVFDSSRITVIS